MQKTSDSLKQRQQNLQKMRDTRFDVAIIGGGINGAVSAAALSSRGLRVALIDKGDFAGGCSSNSSNLVWGGIKYMESREFSLVNKLCQSRNDLMRHYPSVIKELRFLTTIQRGFRFPVWFLYLGALVYWLIGRFETRPPSLLSNDLITDKEPCINTSNSQGGFEYSDAYLIGNDARFVFSFIRTAIKEGATVANYTESLGASRRGDHWALELCDRVGGKEFTLETKVVINACGPWVDAHNHLVAQETKHHHLFSKGVHLIVDKIAEEERTLAFFASDGRLFFIIPMGNKTCIGTTDTQVENPETKVTDEDRNFILDNINSLLKLDKPLSKDDIISERCGVRPLAIAAESGVADWVQLSRKHEIEINKSDAYISIFGGKLTDCVNVGEEIIETVSAMGLQLNYSDKRWYGEPNSGDRKQFFDLALEQGLDQHTPEGAWEPLSQRLWRRYGNDAHELMAAINKDHRKAGRAIEGTEIILAEIDWCAANEMIVELEDLLRRRTQASLLAGKEKLSQAAGIEEVCTRLFGDKAREKLEKYRQTSPTVIEVKSGEKQAPEKQLPEKKSASA